MRDKKGATNYGREKIQGLEWDGFHRHHQRAGEVRPAAISALILYPMNALVEDQMARLRAAIDSKDARDFLHQSYRAIASSSGDIPARRQAAPVTGAGMNEALAQGHAALGSSNTAQRI